MYTAIAYPNGQPHMGHFLELIEADALVRFKKSIQEYDVFFLTGTDEHGSKMVETAKKENLSPYELATKNAAVFQNLKKDIDIEYTDFIRTTEERHIKTAQDLWLKMMDNGDIYKKKYQGLYCVGCESFKTEKDLIDGKCPNHDRAPEMIEEENYFFKLSKYTDILIEKLETRELKIIPEFRKNEIVNFAKNGLEDVSFSRPKEVLPWGIEVPNNPHHVMYVWCDALTNYVSGTGYSDNLQRFEKYWPADVHIIGKDISRFHALIWPAMLLSAGIEIPRSIFIHEFVTSKGKKMSKSLGNTINPFDVIEYYGSEALRFFLLKETVKGEDIDFTWARFHNIYESELVNGIGNLVNRIFVMTQKYMNGKVPAVHKDENIEHLIQQAWRNYNKFFDEFDFKNALESCLQLVYFSNRFITEKAPWELFKKDPEAGKHVMFLLLEILSNIALMLYPFIPKTSIILQKALGVGLEKVSIPYGKIREGFRLDAVALLFQKKDMPER